MRALKITLLTIMYVILGTMLAFNLYNVANKIFGYALPNYFGYSFVCTSNESGLKLDGGRLLVVERVAKNSAEVGDLIVFQYDEQLAVSRVLYVLDGGNTEHGGDESRGGYITKTDELNAQPNASVSYSDFYGIVVGNYPGGNVLNYFTSWQFNVLLVTMFVIIVWTNIVIVHTRILAEEEREERKARYEKYLAQQKKNKMAK